MTHKDFFFQILDILDEHKIDYYLIAGTLLGAVRDKDFLPGDTSDTDIAIDTNDYWKVRNLFNRYHLEGTTCKHRYIWRRELCISSLDNQYKVDIFAMEKEKGNYYLYSYKPNPETKRWDYEWRCLYTYRWFYPLKEIDFLGRQVKVPNQYKEVLKWHYGENWKTPDPTWNTHTPPHIDNNYKGFYPAGFSPNNIQSPTEKVKLAFICVNLLRPESTKKTILTLQQQYPDVKIYVADQDLPTAEMFAFYESRNVEYYYVPFDRGLSYCRNFLISQTKEKYLMWGDNDFVFDEKNGIAEAISLLDNKTDIHVVGGAIIKNGKTEHYERQLIYDKNLGTLIYIPLELTNPKAHTFKDKYLYYYCDLTFNIAIARRKIFNRKKIKWLEKLKVRYEHTFIFMCFKYIGNFNVIYFPTLQANHLHTGSAKYQDLRYRHDGAYDFARYWQLKMNFTVTKGDRELYNLEDQQAIKELDIKLPQVEPIEATIQEVEVKPPIQLKSAQFPLAINAFNYLNSLGLNVVLLKETCLTAIKYHRFNEQRDYFIGLDLTKVQDILIQKNLIPIDNTIYLANFQFQIENYVGKIKQIAVEQDNFNVPMPVVSYLTSVFGKDWESYGQEKETK